MLVTLLGMTMLVSPLQSLKDCLLITVIVEGMSMVVISLPSKQLDPIIVTLLGNTVFLQPLSILFSAVVMIALQFSRES